MTKKIFKSTVLVSASVLILGIAFVLGILYQYFGKQLDTELAREASYLAYGVEQQGEEYLQHLKNTDSRITYIGEDGTVIYDNEADAAEMENHKDREEFQEALATGAGEAQRMSSTLSEKTVYYAKRLSDNSVLRVSSTQYSAFALVLQLIQPVLCIIFVMLILAGVFASKIAGKIVEPINELDLEKPDENEIYEEVAPLLGKINRQNRQIRTQLEEARRNQEEFSIITENMQEGLLVIDSYTMILSGNSSAWKIFQVDKPGTGRSVYSLDRNEDFRKVIETVLEGKHGSALLHLDNEFVQLIANPVNRDGKTVGAVLLLMNETEKVQRENLRREFSANVSHELKTPLTSISGFAEIIQDGFVKEEDVKKFAGRIYKEAQRLIQLVEDTIRISQLDEGENPYEWENIDLYTVAKDVCGNLNEAAKKKNVHLYIEGERLICRTVRPILEEILYNLCDNGIKYNKDNGIVTILIKDLGNEVQLSVEDNGIGIPREDRKRVFERFYRVDKSHSKEIGGTGLGLSIVKHGVTFLGGTLKLVSEVDKGTEITVTLPKNRSEK
ncbi:ATP-binding protein [uncultured Blautia sp.]|uniref:sensor histidine kinase n=1 Tax=uncultured Blautia sp. TaxID=765821 RepID=UPI00280B9142|nr:ATP-binding protein [uncultured Blautia sp.]